LPIFRALLLSALFSPVVLTSPSASAEQTWTVNFKDAELEELVRFVAQVTGKTIVVDPKTKGRVQVISSQPLNEVQLYDLFLSILEVNGFAAVESGDTIKIIPLRDARSSAAPVVSQRGQRENSEIVTEVIQLNNISAATLIPVLRPLAPQQAHMAAYAASNAIIISDTAANIARIREVIQQIDKSAVEHSDVVKLENASAEEVVRMLEQLQKSGAAAGQGEPAKTLVLVADKRTNSVLVSGDDMQRTRIRALIRHLDGPLAQSGNVKVTYLQYANAKDLSEVLNKVLQNVQQGTAQQGAPAAGKAKASVEADEGTNSLIITADADVMATLAAVIDRLDIRRAQVLVEAIIVEMNATDSRDLGIQWLFINKNGAYGSSSQNNGLVTGGIGVTPPSDGDDATTDDDPRAGLAALLGSTRGQVLGIGRIDDDLSFNVVLNALQGDNDANILSTPSLLTLDNEEASIVVGQNVPFLTGSYSATGTGGSSNPGNPFQTIERQNVGLTLKVTPHINEGDSLVLEIAQEVSSLTGAASEFNTSDVITNERKIQTKVLADNGQTIVLGGLIQDDIQESATKVPLLGDIPLLGRLFRNDSVTKRKNHLMVFLRPLIVRDSRDLTGATGEKYRTIRDAQLSRREAGMEFLRKDDLPLLPEWEEQLRYLRELKNKGEIFDLQTPGAAAPASPEPADMAPASMEPGNVEPANASASVAPVGIAPVDIAPMNGAPVNMTPANMTTVEMAPAGAVPVSATP
jgi:general secretion pathway protein D